jgi:hypothetical protein
VAGFYFVWFGAQERGTGRIQIRFYREIWREPLYWRGEVPHGKIAVIGDQSVNQFFTGVPGEEKPLNRLKIPGILPEPGPGIFSCTGDEVTKKEMRENENSFFSGQ